MDNKLQKGVLGSALRATRLDKHYTYEALAEKVGITPTHLKHIESEHRKPSIEVLYRLVTELNLSLDTLFYPERNDDSFCQTERLMRRCSDSQLRILYATMEAMLKEDE
ncbi:helix-turn-helix transcriptional regulator [Lacrimispora indolis]|uniref:helix-turn-helix transcriptional regulator n=1 Tax=Lacrimispora indolis TaxID=69825 RepID=UPI0003FF1D9F|nr:helix-turn-helix transcriptional regulator [[Clostridium] methoxybenzovorans]